MKMLDLGKYLALAILISPVAVKACRGSGHETLVYASQAPITKLPEGAKQYLVEILPATETRDRYRPALLQVFQPDEPRSGDNTLTLQMPDRYSSCQQIKPLPEKGRFYVAGYAVNIASGEPNRLLGNIHIKLALLQKREGWD